MKKPIAKFTQISPTTLSDHFNTPLESMKEIKRVRAIFDFSQNDWQHCQGLVML
jgi:hypothetical protein